MRILLVMVLTTILLPFVMGGCEGSGGMGGQGLSFKNITVHPGGRFTVTTNIDDGGTSLIGENPSGQPRASTQPASQPGD